MGGNSCVTSQIPLSDANKLWEELLGIWVVCEQTGWEKEMR